MSSLDVTFEVVTPAYAGGADAEKTDGLRPPTLKGLLRFWWRAMHPELSGEKLFEQEAAIFGSTKTGQGLRIVPLSDPTPDNDHKETKQYNIHNESPLFWMVYGADKHTVKKKDGKKQDVLHERVTIGTRFCFRLSGPRLDDDQWSEVKCALWLLSTFGGFGSRSRRGFGSIQIVEVSEELANLPELAKCNNVIDLATKMQEGLRKIPHTKEDTVPAHTAFSKHRKIVVGPAADDWNTALKSAAKIFYTLRRLLGTEYLHVSKKKPTGWDFTQTNAYRTNGTATGGNASAGAAFGLPHNYNFSSGEKNSVPYKNVSYEVFAEKEETPSRRASPLFFKVIKLSSEQYVPVVLWLPAQFIPKGWSVEFCKQGSSNKRKLGTVTTPKLVPMPNAVEYLFSEDEVSISGDIAGTSCDTPFKGFVATDGWTEVKW